MAGHLVNHFGVVDGALFTRDTDKVVPIIAPHSGDTLFANDAASGLEGSAEIISVYKLPEATSHSAALLSDPALRHLSAQTFTLDQIVATQRANHTGSLLRGTIPLLE